MLNVDHPTPCNTQSQAIWFDPARQHEARALCAACPMQPECLEVTLQTEELMGHRLIGIHAGLTAMQREHLTLTRK